MVNQIVIPKATNKEAYDPKTEQVVLPGSDKKTNSKKICLIPVDVDVEDD